MALEGQLKEIKGKLAKLEDSHRALAEKEVDARAEVKRLQDASTLRDGEGGEEVAELRAQLRAAKAEASKQEKAAEAAREEAEDTRAEYKEVLRTLKDKYRAAKAETARLAGIEEELEALRAAPAPKKAARKKAASSEAATPEKKKKAKAASPSPVKPKARKTSPVADESEDEAPKKKARKSVRAQLILGLLRLTTETEAITGDGGQWAVVVARQGKTQAQAQGCRGRSGQRRRCAGTRARQEEEEAHPRRRRARLHMGPDPKRAYITYNS